MSTKYFDEQCQKCCGTSGETALEWLLAGTMTKSASWKLTRYLSRNVNLQAKGPSSALVSVHEYYEVSITAVGSTIAA